MLIGVACSGIAFAQDSGSGLLAFDIKALNDGLPPEGGINRDTPQETVESFLYFAREADYDSAAHLLNLSRIDRNRQMEVGPVLARQLEEIIDRKVWIDWNALPDRPDGLDAVAASNDPMAGQSRRSIRMELLNMDGRPVPIRLARVKPADGEPVWVFSSQTVENIPALHDIYGPRDFERNMPDWAQKQLFLGLALWEIFIFPLLVLLSIFTGALVHRIAKDIGRRAKPGLTGRIAGALALPLSLVAAGLVIFVVTRKLFVFSVEIDTFMTPALLLMLIGGTLMIVVRVIDMIIEKTLRNDVAELEKPENREIRAFQTNLSAFRRVAIVVAFVGFAGILLTQINFLATTGIALVGSAGVVTLILAFAGRSALSNIMASLQIAVSKAAAIGDSILFDGQWSHVEKINFTYVQLKTWDNRRLIVPVTRFVSEPFENWTKRDPTMTKVVELRLDHTADVDALRERYESFVQENDKVINPDEAQVLVTGHDATGMTVGFYASATDPSTAWQMQCELREAMLKAVAEFERDAEEGRRFLPAERELKTGGSSPPRPASGKEEETE